MKSEKGGKFSEGLWVNFLNLKTLLIKKKRSASISPEKRWKSVMKNLWIAKRGGDENALNYNWKVFSSTWLDAFSHRTAWPRVGCDENFTSKDHPSSFSLSFSYTHLLCARKHTWTSVNNLCAVLSTLTFHRELRFEVKRVLENKSQGVNIF
jgi:hypothetical protein